MTASSAKQIARTSLRQPSLRVGIQSIARSPHDQLPALYRDPSFWGMAATQFLGAFNDNLFKQLILLLSIATLAAGRGWQPSDLQSAWRMFILRLPFLIFIGLRRLSFRPLSAKRTRSSSLARSPKSASMALGTIGFRYLRLESAVNGRCTSCCF